jgi:peptide/nickel transport system substrate-binding protein
MHRADDRTTSEQQLTRREVLRRAGALGAGAALSGALARSAGAAGSLLEAAPTTFRPVLNAQPRSLDVATNFAVDATPYMALINEPLVMLSSDFQLIPWLAHYTHPSPTKHVYRLRPGLRFTDGSPVTTEDVVWSLHRHTEKALGSEISTYFTNVKSVAATGSNEVTVTLKGPDPGFPYFVMYALVLKKSLAEPLGKKYGLPGGQMIGTGPFTLQTFSATGLTLARNTQYWGRRPPVDTIKVSYIQDPQTQKLAMRSGSIDCVFFIQPTDAADYQKLPGVDVITTAGGISNFLSFDLEAKPWSDVHVRRAVAHCWDGAGFVKGPLRGLGEVSNGMVFPWQWRGVLSRQQMNAFFRSLPSYPYSVAAAKAELAKSSVPKGFSTSIIYPSSATNYGLALQSLASNLQQIGISLEVKEATQTAWLNHLYGHKDLGMTAVSYGADYADPHDFFIISYPSYAAVPNNFNLANLKDPQVDRLLKLEAAEQNKARRARYLEQIQRISATDLPYFGLWYDDAVMVIRKPFSYHGFNPVYYLTPWITYLKS